VAFGWEWLRVRCSFSSHPVCEVSQGGKSRIARAARALPPLRPAYAAQFASWG
jgi:hypothetical protein